MAGSYKTEYEAFTQYYIRGKRLPLRHLFVLGLKSLWALVEFAIRYIPGGVGYAIRYHFYKLFVKEMGKNVLIDAGVVLNGARNMSFGDYVWIDTNCRIDAMMGEVKIGRRVHMAPFALIFAREPITVGDYVGLGAYSRIYSSSEVPKNGMRACGPMVPEEMRGVEYAPISIGNECLVATGAVLLPGANMGEGSVVAANSVLSKPVEPWTIVGGLPAKPFAKRDPVTQPAI